MVRAVHMPDWDHWDENGEAGSFSLVDDDDKAAKRVMGL